MALIQAAFMHHPETMLMEMRSTCAGHKVPARAQACHRQHAAHFISRQANQKALQRSTSRKLPRCWRMAGAILMSGDPLCSAVIRGSWESSPCGRWHPQPQWLNGPLTPANTVRTLPVRQLTSAADLAFRTACTRSSASGQYA